MTDRPTMGQDVYGFHTGRPVIGVMLWDGTNASAAKLIADLAEFCNLRGAIVVNAHARASIMGGMEPRIDLTVHYPDNGVLQDFTFQRYDALVLFAVNGKLVHIQTMSEVAARMIIGGERETVVLAERTHEVLGIMRGPLG